MIKNRYMRMGIAAFTLAWMMGWGAVGAAGQDLDLLGGDDGLDVLGDELKDMLAPPDDRDGCGMAVSVAVASPASPARASPSAGSPNRLSSRPTPAMLPSGGRSASGSSATTSAEW